MSLIIENGKVIKATGDVNQIVADFNEYLKFVRETTIPVPKDQFTSLNENHAKLYSDHVEVIKANKDLQEQLNELQKAYDEVCASKEKLRIENSKIFRERDTLQRECISRESARSLMRSAMCCRKHMMMLRLTGSQKMKKLTMIYPLSLLKYMIILVPTKQEILHLLLSVHVQIQPMIVLLLSM